MEPNEQFLRLFLRYQEEVKAFVASMVRDREAAKDLFQETSLALWQGFGNYDPARPFGAWARGVAAKKVFHYWEKSRRTPAPFSPEAGQAVLDACERSEERSMARLEGLKDCVDRLPARSRDLLALRYQRSMKLGEIAREAGSTLDAVHKLLSRIRAALQECMKRRSATGEEGGA